MVKNVNSCAVANTSCTYNHNDSRSNPPILRTPIITRKFPRKQNIWVDELVLFQAADKIVDIDSISEQNSHENFTFVRRDNSGLYFNLICNEETGILAVHECFSADRNLHVRFSYHGLVILLPQWFRYKINCTLLNLVCLKTLSPISEIIKVTVLSELSKLSERSKCSECQLKLVATESGIAHDDYLQQLFRGGATGIVLRQKQPPEVFCKKRCS